MILTDWPSRHIMLVITNKYSPSSLLMVSQEASAPPQLSLTSFDHRCEQQKHYFLLPRFPLASPCRLITNLEISGLYIGTERQYWYHVQTKQSNGDRFRLTIHCSRHRRADEIYFDHFISIAFLSLRQMADEIYFGALFITCF